MGIRYEDFSMTHSVCNFFHALLSCFMISAVMMIRHQENLGWEGEIHSNSNSKWREAKRIIIMHAGNNQRVGRKIHKVKLCFCRLLVFFHFPFVLRMLCTNVFYLFFLPLLLLTEEMMVQKEFVCRIHRTLCGTFLFLFLLLWKKQLQDSG